MRVTNYFGNCVNSFDDSCNCIIDSLPWRDATDFAQALDNAEVVKPFEYPSWVAIPHPFEYYQVDGVYIVYDDEDDVHYFFSE